MTTTNPTINENTTAEQFVNVAEQVVGNGYNAHVERPYDYDFAVKMINSAAIMYGLNIENVNGWMTMCLSLSNGERYMYGWNGNAYVGMNSKRNNTILVINQ